MKIHDALKFAMLIGGLTGTSMSLLEAGSTAGAQARSATVKKESPFACDMTALTPEQRARHFEVLGPKLRVLRKEVRELPDGYEIEFMSDAATYLLLTEWAAGERACCPFFDLDVRSTREHGPLLLRLTGREGVKKFIEIEGASWLEK